jgi:hypothetical protein
MSGRKSNLGSYQTFTNADMSQATLTSALTNIEFLDNVGIQLSWAGTSPVGTFEVQVSLDHQQDQYGNVTNAGNWAPISFTSPPAVSGNTGSVYLDINQISAPWIRVVYTKTSGIGLLNGYICGKMV